MRQHNEQLIKTFNHICDWAQQYSSVQVQIGERRMPIYQAHNECTRMLCDIIEKDSTQFMVAPILEYYFDLIKPAITIPYSELCNENLSRVNECKAFESDLNSHPVREAWAKQAEAFKCNAESMGYSFAKSDYKDIAFIAPILINALTAHDKYCCKRIYTLSAGKKTQATPKILKDIAIFSTVHDAKQALSRLTEPAYIGFVGIRPLNKQTSNAFDTWYYGVDTRKRNLCRYQNMTGEEVDNSFDDYRTKLYVVVRNGENLWMYEPPAELGQGETLVGKDGFLNYYKKRITYAPIQIFFKNPPAPGESTALTVPRAHSWNLTDILDEEQKIWLPVFLQEVKKKFFDNDYIGELGLCAEDTQLQLALPDGSIHCNYPVSVQNVIHIPDPEELFSRDTPINEDGSVAVTESQKRFYRNAIATMKWLGITSKDISDIPFGWNGVQLESEAKKLIETQAIRAYYRVLKTRMDSMKQERFEAQQWFHKYLCANTEDILSRAIRGEITCATICIDKQPLIHHDGVRHPDVAARTDINLSKYHHHPGQYSLYPYREWLPTSLIDKKPPVQIIMEVKSLDDVAQICKGSIEEIPAAFRYLEGYILPETCVWNLSKPEYKKFSK